MSRPDQAVFLVSSTITSDEIGNQIKTLTERLVFAEELSVGSGEFYNAALNGLRPSKRFEIYVREYLGEAKLKHNGINYRIIRTGGKGEKIELTCEAVAADGLH
ncbi:phage head-tail adapter protein [Desulfosporosinus sp.]|uniref:phage head-tail adapter protein n=1 Tax=Desulfosporosinus sp. TaxID=157907 RepID=UPI0025BA4807|nr:phage head-tail adapter protein [Desulfosporosinus sp.]MBC2722338.1 phage head-tail adapter protein [Desulfosporosinus sp.]MBC2728628.1 phage head-tail adapter protein [Desulfosporosinus sp.]